MRSLFSFRLKSFRLKDFMDCLHETLSNPIGRLHVPAFSIGMTLWHAHISDTSCLPPFIPVNMEFNYFFCALLLCKVLLLIKQQRELWGKDGRRKLTFAKVNLIRGLLVTRFWKAYVTAANSLQRTGHMWTWSLLLLWQT